MNGIIFSIYYTTLQIKVKYEYGSNGILIIYFPLFGKFQKKKFFNEINE